MIISRISKGSLAAGDGRAALGAPGETPPDRVPRVLGRLRYQTRLVSNLTAVVTMAQAATINTRTTKQAIVEIPDKEDARAFINNIEGVVSGGRAPTLEPETHLVQYLCHLL